MSFDIFVVLFTLIFLLWGLYSEKFHPAAVFFIAVSILVVAGIISPNEALSGFSNPSIAVILLLLIISNIIQKSGIVNYYLSKILSENLSYKSFIGRMFLSVSSISAFLNNTPIVAMLLPYVYHWSNKKDIPPSKLLIPLSYAAILGGTITLIGTSTNLVVNGLAIENGVEAFHIFDFAYVGIPATILGFLYIYFIGYRLLPSREDPLKSFFKKKKEYMVETIVKENSKLIGKSVREAKLRNLKGLFLAEILRKNKKISPVSPEEIIEENDILIFVGETEAITDLISSNYGLSLPDFCNLNEEKVDIVEVVISNNSSLINKKVRETDFRAKYDAAILAIHRNGEKLKGKIGEVILKPGDLLLLLTGKDFWKRAEDTTDFYVISKIKELFNVDRKKGNIAFFGFLFTIIFSAIGVIPLFTGLILLITLLVLFKISTYLEIKKGLDINLAIIAALSMAVGKGIINSGLAELIALYIKDLLLPFGIIGALAGIYLITNILTEFVTNVAAASIVFPIALSTANILSVEPMAFLLAVAFGASASFITPIGYQTNLMVYSAGNYRFKDFLKVGLPLAILYGIICICILYIVFITS
ncbi:SLC13 family permease [Persephonella sp. IF05-L8]|uniref:SLC13 family permease n=1 Tax=Persephonella sp. IF05-L8 TaxID=1158338 RepID=UPI000495D413